MLACTRIGAPHSVVFAGFSAESIRDRILDASSKWVITAENGIRGGRIIPLKATVDAAITACPCVQKVFVFNRPVASPPRSSAPSPAPGASEHHVHYKGTYAWLSVRVYVCMYVCMYACLHGWMGWMEMDGDGWMDLDGWRWMDGDGWMN